MKLDIPLKSSHLIIPSDVSNQLLSQSSSVYVAYKKELNTLLVSPKENTWFPKLHDAMEFLLKSKDLKGTKSVAIREILIDHEIDDRDTLLSGTVVADKKFLKIELPLHA